MASKLFVRRMCSVLALVLVGTGGFAVPPAAGAKQDAASAAGRDSSESAGDLDPTFGNGGIQTTDFFGNYDVAVSVALQADGKIVAAGSAFHGGTFNTSDFALARYNPDGSLDPGFGVAGKQTSDFFGSRDEANGVAIQPDGKIVAVGLAQHDATLSTADFAVARYNPDGSLDPTFSSGGKQTTDFFGNTDDAFGVVVQRDGKILVAGYASHGDAVTTLDFALARYNADGSLDQSFGSAGKVTTDFFGSEDVAYGIAIQPDGKIVLAGDAFHTDSFLTSDFALARYNPDGALDPTFGTGGKQTTDLLGGYDNVTSVAIQPDSRIVVAGSSLRASGGQSSVFALARYNPDGSLDPTFGAGGKQTTGFSGFGDSGQALAIQPDGKIVVGGSAGLGSSTYDFALARYNPDGGLDQTFGSFGTKTNNFFGSTDEDVALGLAIQADGKIVLVGFAGPTNDSHTFDFALARYNVEPDFAISFNPTSVAAQAGTKAPVTVLINRTGGFSGNVTVTPPAASMGIKPKPPDPVTTTGDSAVFKMKVGGGVPPGSYDRTYTATDDSGRTRTAKLTIVVQ